MFDYLIVGAGFAGSVMAERLATDAGKKVLVIDKRNHVGGNAYDHYDDAGVLVHKYGPHIFHTNSREVFEYLSRFTEWRQYQHRVQAWVDGQLLPIPINLSTINRMYGLSLTSFELNDFFERLAEKRPAIRTSEVLPQLHAQAMGPGSVGARRGRHGARSRTHEQRRSLFHRFIPGDAEARVHAAVREDAGAPQHQGAAQRRLPRSAEGDPARRGHLHRAGR
jgi:2-polyprenyl-6-methoxyphenol hydroxylase-like FAD-dependent oxidoreductase